MHKSDTTNLNIKALEIEFQELFSQRKSLGSSEWQSRINAISLEANTLKIPSLEFALKRLAHQRKEGISSINIGGTMGCGKSSLAEYFVSKLGFQFKDADHFHPAANLKKMSKGEALTSADRAPFLSAVQEWLRTKNVISTCSALSEQYRAILYGQSLEVLDPSSKISIWDIEKPNLGALQIMLTKPYEIAIAEFESGAARTFDNQPHFAKVTKAAEEAATLSGKTPLLLGQYQLFEATPIYSWEAILLDTQRLLASDGTYSSMREVDWLVTNLLVPTI